MQTKLTEILTRRLFDGIDREHMRAILAMNEEASFNEIKNVYKERYGQYPTGVALYCLKMGFQKLKTNTVLLEV